MDEIIELDNFIFNDHILIWSSRFETNETCSICLDNSNHNVVSTYCNHKFHYTCISRWINLQNSNSCPMCRKLIYF